MVTFVEPSASDPALIVVQLSVRLITHVPSLAVVSVISVAVNPITVPVSVLLPGEGDRGCGVGSGRGVGVGLTPVVVAVGVVVVVGVQLTRSMALARMQIEFFVVIDSCCLCGLTKTRHFLKTCPPFLVGGLKTIGHGVPFRARVGVLWSGSQEIVIMLWRRQSFTDSPAVNFLAPVSQAFRGWRHHRAN